MCGALNQAVWWCGGLHDGDARRATAINARGNVVFTFGARQPRDAAGVEGEHAVGAYVWTVDPAVERAGLLGDVAHLAGAPSVFPGVGLLTSSDAGVGEASRALAGFKVIEELAWRRERVRDAVRSLGGGLVEVKTRGKACDPDVEQAQLRGVGSRSLVVFVLRFGVGVRAIIAERV